MYAAGLLASGKIYDAPVFKKFDLKKFVTSQNRILIQFGVLYKKKFIRKSGITRTDFYEL